MDVEMPDRRCTVRSFLESQVVGKAAVIDRTVEILEAQGYEFLGELKELTYEEVIGLKVPVFAAKKLESHLKLPGPSQHLQSENMLERLLTQLLEERTQLRQQQGHLVEQQGQILRVLLESNVDTSTTASASKISLPQFHLLKEALWMRGPFSKDFSGKPVHVTAGSMGAIAGHAALNWNPDLYENQQKGDYKKVISEQFHVQGHKWLLADGDREAGEPHVLITKQFPNLRFKVTSKTDMVLYREGMCPADGSIMGLEVKPDLFKDFDRYLRQAQVELFVFADASQFPFVQVLTDLRVVICMYVRMRDKPELHFTVGHWDDFVANFSSFSAGLLHGNEGSDAEGEGKGGPRGFQYLQPDKFTPPPSSPGLSGSLKKRLKGADDETMRRVAMWQLATEYLQADEEEHYRDDFLADDFQAFDEGVCV